MLRNRTLRNNIQIWLKVKLMQNERGNGKSSRDDFDKMTAIFRNRFCKIAHICEYYCVNTVWIGSNWAAGQIGLHSV